MFIKSKYLPKIITFLVKNKLIWDFLTRYINIKLRLNEIIFTLKPLTFLFSIIWANFF